MEYTGKPMLPAFQCTDEDIQRAGLTCSEEDPCPVYLELASMESTGIRLYTAGNIHAATATLFSIILGSDDNGHSWREVHVTKLGNLNHFVVMRTDCQPHIQGISQVNTHRGSRWSQMISLVIGHSQVKDIALPADANSLRAGNVCLNLVRQTARILPELQ